MIDRRGSAARDLLAVLALLAATLAVYWPVTGFEFVFYDDNAYVFENPRVARGLTAEGIAWAFTHYHAANWHPLTWLSHMLDCELWGLDAGRHHLTSLLLHAGNGALLFAVLRRMRGAFGPSLVVAALFALHPLRVESVAWVAERKDVLAGFFGTTTLLAYAHYARRPAAGRYLLVAGSFALGLLAKPMLVTLPFVLLLLDAWPLERIGPRTLTAGRAAFPRRPLGALALEKVPLLVLAALSSLATLLVQQASGVVRTMDALPLGARLANAATSYVYYLAKTIWPTDLAFFHPHPALYDPAGFAPLGWRPVGAALVLAALTAAVLLARRRRPWLAVGWLWYLGTLVPVLGLVQVGEQAVAERYAYLPLIGIYLAVAFGLAELAARRPGVRLPFAAAAGLALAALAIATRAETRHWRDSVALFERAIAVTEKNYVAHLNLGYLYQFHRRPPRRIEARREYLLAAAIRPEDLRVNYNLGLLYRDEENVSEAIRCFENVRRVQPDLPDVHRELGALYDRIGDPTLALHHFEEAVRLAPAAAEHHSNLARLRRQRGDLPGAAAEYREAIQRRPAMTAERLELAACLEALNDHAGAAWQYRELLRLVPGSGPAAARLAWLLATSHDDAVRDGVEALGIARALAAAEADPAPEILDALAAALAETGNFDEAVRREREALERADPPRRAEYRGRLELYLSQRPFRR
ncbi:MAG: tetratricopeptide repeat protein [Planctomycetota bacterium]